MIRLRRTLDPMPWVWEKSLGCDDDERTCVSTLNLFAEPSMPKYLLLLLFACIELPRGVPFLQIQRILYLSFLVDPSATVC